ncbi:MAG TPA: Flp pilus assembly protein CpaB [Myxococcota bacterium]|nr:Flp pilus assembly protein CpaB [Myxococcota bacterium]
MLKGKTALVVALGLGLVAALLAFKTIQRTQDEITRGWHLKPMAVAARDIEEGTLLDYDMLARMDSPEQFVTGSVVEPKQIEKVIGQRVMVPLQRGDPILWSHFYSEGTFERMSRIVTKRGRAISLDISGSQGVAGWVRPGDRIDILGTFTDPKDGQMASVTLMQDVVVLATGGLSAGAAKLPNDRLSNYASVTLMVLPEEAEILNLAAELGKLRLTLRNAEDIATMESRGRATIQTLMTGERIKDLMNLRKHLPDVVRPPAFR